MYTKLSTLIYALENNEILTAIRNGFVAILPISLIGSIAVFFLNLPLPFIHQGIEHWGNGIIKQFLVCFYEATMGMISIYLVLSISHFSFPTSKPINPTIHMLATITSFICFFSTFGAISGSLTFADFGPSGIFSAIICSTLFPKLFFKLFSLNPKKIKIYSMGSDSHFKASLLAFFPMIICISISITMNFLLSTFLGVSNLNDYFTLLITSIFNLIDSELANGILFTFLLNFLWIFGIHGGNVLDEISNTAFVFGDFGSNTIISKSFLDIFAQLGGSGSSLCLVIALLLFSRSKNARKLTRVSLPMILFNINELLVFGLPIVFNPIMAIPFVLVPLVSLLIAYFATVFNFIPIFQDSINWTIPIGYSGYLATGSLSGVIVQVVILIVGVCIYAPFIYLMDSIQSRKLNTDLFALIEDFKNNETKDIQRPLLNGHDELSQIAKLLVVQLKQDLISNNFDMYYQPQVNGDDKVIGGEALLRWNFHDVMIYPPLVVALAIEDDFIDLLTESVLIKSCHETRLLSDQIEEHIHISVNVLAYQINDIAFVNKIISTIKEYHVENKLHLEITEETSLEDLTHIPQNLELLKANGIFLAIDDFGMGKTSLTHLNSNHFTYVKIDGSLIRQVLTNPRSCQIITSLIELGDSLGYEVIAEYVENKEVKDLLMSLGCHVFQGYYYSPAVPLNDFIKYFNLTNNNHLHSLPL